MRYENRFSLLSHGGNANESYAEFHLTPGEMAAIKKTDHSNTGKDIRKEKPVFSVARNVNNAVTMEISMEVSQKQSVIALIYD